MQIELRQLRYFVAVAEEQHFGRAAIRLHMTQPPLSQAIQNLEAQLGAQLFNRTTRQSQLSAAGLALLPEAKRLLAQAELLPDLVKRAASGQTGELRLAFISIADYSILPPALRKFRQNHHAVKIELSEATSDKQLVLLEKSEIDLGFLIPPIPSALSTQIHYKKVRSEALILAIPESEAQRQNPNELTTYKDLPLILFPRKIAPALHDSILSCFGNAGLTPVVSQEAIQMQTIIALVSATMGMALVPESVSNLKRPGVTYYPLNQNQSGIEIGVAWRKDNPSPVLQAFLDIL
nr:LysR family transcriptional regulator [uncultured Undibacterium sp.]